MPLGEGYKPEDFKWRVRKVFNWMGHSEMMIELDELDGCVSFGDTLREAKKGLTESLFLWIRQHGEQQLPDIYSSARAHLIILESPMREEEFEFVNTEIKKLD